MSLHFAVCVCLVMSAVFFQPGLQIRILACINFIDTKLAMDLLSVLSENLLSANLLSVNQMSGTTCRGNIFNSSEKCRSTSAISAPIETFLCRRSYSRSEVYSHNRHSD